MLNLPYVECKKKKCCHTCFYSGWQTIDLVPPPKSSSGNQKQSKWKWGTQEQKPVSFVSLVQKCSSKARCEQETQICFFSWLIEHAKSPQGHRTTLTGKCDIMNYMAAFTSL